MILTGDEDYFVSQGLSGYVWTELGHDPRVVFLTAAFSNWLFPETGVPFMDLFHPLRLHIQSQIMDTAGFLLLEDVTSHCGREIPGSPTVPVGNFIPQTHRPQYKVAYIK